MPIKAVPYEHQVKAFNFVCELFGVVKSGEPSQTVHGRLNLTGKKAGDANEHFQK
jgi:hypothetical protein